ncbi:uncharacterized protein RAG0_10110 [Rhynchosporium agropyri]|uniref:DNA recombination and repair protein Rad51-like C-terminal domain-containing protein n=1 Tax=Rhynchosporium agropyri TaxID=914238 RepID=A0A1E1KYJ2_9HELO|nr:uncharacterized protein RAG0_10110 [Rhynchosporium agropyri]
MIHIDHSLLTNAPPSPPKPALPIIASHLLALEEKQRKRFSGKGRPERLSAGCREVDEVLGGGVERGVVLGISAGVEDKEARLLSLHLLASVLLPSRPSLSSNHQSTSQPPRTKAIIIDTSGSFPLPLLASVLKSRLLEIQSQKAQNAVKTGNHAVKVSEPSKDARGAGSGGVDDEVQKCLEMVAVSRVFDVEGLWEVIGEVDHADSVSMDRDSRGEDDNNREMKGGGAGEGAALREQDVGDDEVEILDSEEDLTSPTLPVLLKDQELQLSENEGTEIIIVDNMTHIINELFARKEKSDAHTLLTLLSSTLHTLSKTKNILTVLHNATNPSTNPQYSNPLSHNSNQNQNQNHNHSALQATTTRSIFASAATKPALGQIFAQFPDIHVFMHRLPRGRRDAEVLYSGGIDADVFPTTTDREAFTNRDAFTDETKPAAVITYTTILEILKDEAPLLDVPDSSLPSRRDSSLRFAYREQKWTAIDVSPDGLGIVGAFAERGGMKGMGMSREKGRTRIDEGLSGGVGNVAKVWGFGGPRV